MNWLRLFFKKLKEDFSNKSPKDPVCGMRATDGITLIYEGQEYSFCSEHCRQQFQSHPEKYVRKS